MCLICLAWRFIILITTKPTIYRNFTIFHYSLDYHTTVLDSIFLYQNVNIMSVECNITIIYDALCVYIMSGWCYIECNMIILPLISRPSSSNFIDIKTCKRLICQRADCQHDDTGWQILHDGRIIKISMINRTEKTETLSVNVKALGSLHINYYVKWITIKAYKKYKKCYGAAI